MTGLRPKDCATCGATYAPTGTKQRFCSTGCVSKDRSCEVVDCAGVSSTGHRLCNMHRMRERKGTTLCAIQDCGRPMRGRGGVLCADHTPEPPELPRPSCVICGRTITDRARDSTSCGRACDLVRERRRFAIEAPQRDASRTSPRAFRCRECAEPVVTVYRDKRRIYCSIECSVRYSRRLTRRRGTPLIRRRGADRIRRMRPRLLTRYAGRCGICGYAIDLTLDWVHPLSLTIDHIQPISAGGSDDESNLWPAHRRCNEEKGDEIGWSSRSLLFATRAG